MKIFLSSAFCVILILIAACTKQEEPEKKCTDPDFGETISSTSGKEDGKAYASIGTVWGTDNDNLTYEWSNGAKGKSIKDVEPGIYTVTISNDEGCSVTKEFDLTFNSGGNNGELKLGDEGEAGGTVFYIDGSTVYEAAPVSSIWSGKKWGCSGTSVNTSQGVGSGQTNTTKILNACSDSDVPARLCNDYSYNGFDDWFLPSVDELDKLSYAIYLKNLTGYKTGYYWSSSEFTQSIAYSVQLPDGGVMERSKNTGSYVIAVRKYQK